MNSSSFTQSLQQLGKSYLSVSIQNAERIGSLLSGTFQKTPGSLDVDDLSQRYAAFVRTEGPRVAQQFAEASLNYYSLLVTTGVEVVSRFYQQVLLPASDGTQARTPEPAKAAAALLFRGAPGAKAQNAFLVTNNRQDAIDVGFDIGALTAAGGDAQVRPLARFSPARCRLEPGASQVVQCTLQVPPDLAPDQDYGGRILVAGFPDLAMDIRLRAEKPAPEQSAAPPPARQEETAGSRKKVSAGAAAPKAGSRGQAKKA